MSSRARRNRSIQRPYPPLGFYPDLNLLGPEDHPVGFPEPVKDYSAPPATHGAFVDPARLSGDEFVRWCRSCDTVLKHNGQSPFCARCKADHEGVLRQRRALARKPDLPIRKEALEDLHELADAVRFDFAQLAIAYAADKKHLARHVHVLNRNLANLLHHLSSQIEDPRPPEQRYDATP